MTAPMVIFFFSKNNCFASIKIVQCDFRVFVEFVVKPKGRAYVDDLVTKVIELCSMNSYQHLTDFEVRCCIMIIIIIITKHSTFLTITQWYVAALVELTRVRGMTSGELVAEQFTNVAVRVPSVRPFAVRQVRPIFCFETMMIIIMMILMLF